jgi:hypothetical protein
MAVMAGLVPHPRLCFIAILKTWMPTTTQASEAMPFFERLRAGDNALERARRQLEDRLNAATRRAYEIVGAG